MQVLTVTEKAKRHVLKALADEPESDRLALWVEVIGARQGEYAYDLYFDRPEKAVEGDAVHVGDDLTVVIPSESVELMQGATLDMSRDLLNPGMVITNPNRPPEAAAASPNIEVPRPEDLTGTVEERVTQVLERYINPSIAGHGGRADLVRVEGGAALVRLSGGCQGCGMAAQTLRNGIEVAIKQAVPEIAQIVDATDHAAGENPYISSHSH